MIPLEKYLTATFDGAGVARISALPDRARDTWRVTGYVTHTNSSTPTDLAVYIGSDNTGNRIDYTGSGNDDVSEHANPVTVQFGRPLIFVWGNGSSGALAEIFIRGEVVKV